MKRQYLLLLGFLSVSVIILSCISDADADSADSKQITFKEGQFLMGSSYCLEEQSNSDWCSDEIPHQVMLRAYMIDKYEVTNSEYMKCFAEGVCNPNDLHETRPNDFNKVKQPVVFVSWYDAKAFCVWRGGSLPTEAQWERAANGSNPGGAHFKKPYNSGSTTDVGGQQPNSNGLFDMMGNVYEWTLDWYGAYSLNHRASNPKGPLEGKEKVVRGGSWNSPSHYLRIPDRVAKNPKYKYSDVGFRCVYPVS